MNAYIQDLLDSRFDLEIEEAPMEECSEGLDTSLLDHQNNLEYVS